MQFRSIVKMDFYRLYRNKAMKFIVLIPFLGFWINFRWLEIGQNEFLDYLKLTAFSLAFTVGPIIFASSILASKDDDIFSNINIKLHNYIGSKLVNLVPIALYSFICTVVPYFYIGEKNNVDLSTVLYYMKFVLVYYFIYYIIYVSVGYFLGGILGNILKGAFSFMLGLMFIYFSSGITTGPEEGLTLANINNYTLTNIFRFDIYTNNIFQFFLLMSITLMAIYFMIITLRQRKKIGMILVIPIIALGFLALLSFDSLESKKSVKIQPYERLEINESLSIKTGQVVINSHEDRLEISKNIPTVVNSINDEGFIINKYKMNIDLEEEFKNRVEIDITLTEESKEAIEFQFFGKSKVSKMKVNGEDVNYTMDSSRLYIDLNSIDLNENKKLKILVEYSSYIYTYRDVLGYHYVSKNGAFLDPNLAWYPMIDNGTNKDFEVEINTDNEKLFSNLDVDKSSNGYNLNGKTTNIILMSGDNRITSITKDGIEYYGIDLVINNEKEMKFYEGYLPAMDDAIKNIEGVEGVEKEMRFYDRKSVKKIFVTGTAPIMVEQTGDSINF